MTTLKEHGLAVGDLVTCTFDDDCTGGIVYRISENCDSMAPKDRNKWSRHFYDDKGKLLTPMQVEGYLRLKPFFSFFPSKLGENPKGKGGTVLIYHANLDCVHKVDVVSLASKYAELGTLVRDVAIARGMTETPKEG